MENESLVLSQADRQTDRQRWFFQWKNEWKIWVVEWADRSLPPPPLLLPLHFAYFLKCSLWTWNRQIKRRKTWRRSNFIYENANTCKCAIDHDERDHDERRWMNDAWWMEWMNMIIHSFDRSFAHSRHTDWRETDPNHLTYTYTYTYTFTFTYHIDEWMKSMSRVVCYLFVYSSTQPIRPSVRPSFHLSIRSFIHSFIHLFIHLSMIDRSVDVRRSERVEAIDPRNDYSLTEKDDQLVSWIVLIHSK